MATRPTGLEATSPDTGAAFNGKRLALFGFLAGTVLALLWSAPLVDRVIGDTIATGLLGFDAEASPIASIGVGAAFAFVAGLAGTFTACNIAVMGAVAPMVSGTPSVGNRVVAALRPVGWLALGACGVSALYGALGVTFASYLPQLSEETVGGMPVRIVQSSVIFGLIGLVLVYFALGALSIVRDPWKRLAARAPYLPLLLVGALVGAFLIGRPFRLFRIMFEHAAEVGNPAYGALAFVLQSLGNIALVAVVFVVAFGLAGQRLQRWFTASAGRAPSITGVAFMVAGAFTFVYWVVRIPARFGYGWFPTMPWNM